MPVLAAPVVYPHEGVSTTDDRAVARAVLARRYRHQATAAGLLRHRRALQGCHRWVAFGKDAVDLVSYPRLKKGKLKGLQSCGSPHICPVCAPKIAERRVKYDLTPGLARARELGLGVLVVNTNLRHSATDDFGENMDALLLARESSRSGGRWTRLRKRFGVVGSIRAFECTYGVNGFHPHFHDLFLFAAPLSAVQQEQFALEMKGIWQECIEKAGLAPVTLEHGCHISAAHKDIEEYVQKQLRAGTPKEGVKRPRWDLPQEMAKMPVKAGRTRGGVKGYSLFELLAIASDGEIIEGAPTPARAAAVFREYDAVITTRRVRQLYWSPGLKALLGVKDLSDAQIEALDEEDKEAEVFATLAPPEIAALIADDRRAELTSLLAENDLPGTLALIAPYRRAPATEKFDPVWEELFPVPAFDPNRPTVKTHLPCLTDWQADERDFLPPVRSWVDPLAALLAVNPQHGASLALALRRKNGAGESTHHFDAVRRGRRERELHFSPLQELLAALYADGGGKGRVTRSEFNPLPGTPDYDPSLPVHKVLTWSDPGKWAVWRFLVCLHHFAPWLAELATEDVPPKEEAPPAARQAALSV